MVSVSSPFNLALRPHDARASSRLLAAAVHLHSRRRKLSGEPECPPPRSVRHTHTHAYMQARCLTFGCFNLTKVCERSLGANQGGPSMPLVQPFVRGEMLPSGFLVRPSDGGGSVIHIVDHMDLEVITESRKIRRQLLYCLVPEVADHMDLSYVSALSLSLSALERARSRSPTVRVVCDGCSEDVNGGTAPWTSASLLFPLT